MIDNQTGLLFKLKDIQDLKDKIAYLFENNAVCEKLGENAFNMLNQEYSSEVHYKKLNNLFENVVAGYQTVNKSISQV